jgi:hypothetical protein
VAQIGPKFWGWALKPCKTNTKCPFSGSHEGQNVAKTISVEYIHFPDFSERRTF